MSETALFLRKNLIDERDLVSAQQNQLIEQNNKTIQQQIQNVTDLNSQVSSKEQKVDELQNQNIKLISLIDEKISILPSSLQIQNVQIPYCVRLIARL